MVSALQVRKHIPVQPAEAEVFLRQRVHCFEKCRSESRTGFTSPRALQSIS